MNFVSYKISALHHHTAQFVISLAPTHIVWLLFAPPKARMPNLMVRDAGAFFMLSAAAYRSITDAVLHSWEWTFVSQQK